MPSINAIVGAIKRVVYMPCAPTPFIWAETFAPATLEMILTNIAPTWKQEIEIATGKSWIKNIKQIVNDTHGPIAPIAATPLKSLFGAYATLDTVNYWLWLADMIGEEAYNWSTLAARYSPCGRSKHGNWWTGNRGVGEIPNNLAWIDAPPCVATSGGVAGIAPSGGLVPKGHQAQIGYALLIGPEVPLQGTGEIRIINLATGEVYDSDTATISDVGANPWLMCFSPNLLAYGGDLPFQVQCRFGGIAALGGVNIVSAWVAASLAPLT